MRNFLLFSIFLLGFLSHQVMAETLILEPEKDNTLFDDAQGRFSNGAGQYLFMGRTAGDKGLDRLLRRALVSFDLTDIPSGSQISRVELRLTIDKVAFGASDGTATIHRLLSDWGEASSDAPGPEGQGTWASAGDATWVHTFFDTESWTTEGGDYSATASQGSIFSSSPQTLVFPSSAELTADVDSWVNQPENNFGWIIRGDEVVEQNARRFLSREHSNTQGRPTLTIEYTPAVDVSSVPATGRIGLFLLILMMLVKANRNELLAGRSLNHKP
jgi:hypothetical protein